MPDVRVFPDSKSLATSAAEQFINLADQSILAQGRFSVALSGGSTPKLLYRILASPENQARLDWENIHLFFGDERYVPPDHIDSNFRLIKQTLLDKVDIPVKNIHPVPTQLDVKLAADNYEMRMRDFFEGDWPRFDLILLGMGEDGHTASLFPYSAGLEDQTHWFISNFAPKRSVWRLTLTKNAINSARNILVIVSGKSKAEMLEQVITDSEETKEKPIHLISPKDGKMAWFVDQDAITLHLLNL